MWGLQCIGLLCRVCARSSLKQPERIELFIPQADTAISKPVERYWCRLWKGDVFRDLKLCPDKALSERAEGCEEYITVDRDWEQRIAALQADSESGGSETDTMQQQLRK